MTYHAYVAPAEKSQEYAEYYLSARWKILRSLRKRFDGGCCRTCGATRHLQCHHVTYHHRGIGNSRGLLVGLLEFVNFVGLYREFKDLITLCDGCHAAVTQTIRARRTQ